MSNMSKILNAKGMNVNVGGKNDAFKNFQARKASEASSAMGRSSNNSKSPPRPNAPKAAGPRGPNKPVSKSPNKEEAANEVEHEEDGDGTVDLP